jgi:hypothetical protein
VENTPFADVSILTLAVSLDDPRMLYVATMVGVFRSQDGGDTWQNLETLEAITPTNPADKNPPIFVITTDPFDSGIVYAGSPRGGVFRSKDGGDTWAQASFGMDPNESIYDLLPDPNRPGVLYASTSTSGVYYTTDRGEHWIALNDGISGKWVDQLALSGDGSVLYAASHVSGVLRLGTPSSAPALDSGEKPAEPRNGGWPCVGGMLPLVLAGLVGILRKRKSIQAI